MEEHFIFNKIKMLKPDKLFHPIDCYLLKWKPPNSYFQLIIPLTDHHIQESVIIEISKQSKADQKKIIFFFSPKLITTSLYAIPVHPASLVKFNTKNSVLNKLSNLFLENRIPLQDMQQIFTCDHLLWKAALYNYLPVDWQPYHTYLNEKPIVTIDEKDIEKNYLEGEISLNEYGDFKYPDRKKMRDILSATYPLPYKGQTCIICKIDEIGIIKCQSCDNMCCIACIKSRFGHNNETAEGSFLLMHHKYCLRLGKLQPINPVIVSEPAYLRQFRNTTRNAILEMLQPGGGIEEIKLLEDEMDDDEDEEEKLQRELALKLLAEEELRIKRENPEELKIIRKNFIEKKKKVDKMLKDIDIYREKSNDISSTEMFRGRNKRLLNEEITKLTTSVKPSLEKLKREAAKLSLIGQYIESFNNDVDSLINIIDVLNEELVKNTSEGS